MEETKKSRSYLLNRHLPETNHLQIDDIARSHRLGAYRRNAERPRPIIARFSRETKKLDTYRVEKELKGKGIRLTENLTHYGPVYTAVFHSKFEAFEKENQNFQGQFHVMNGIIQTHAETFNDPLKKTMQWAQFLWIEFEENWYQNTWHVVTLPFGI